MPGWSNMPEALHVACVEAAAAHVAATPAWEVKEVAYHHYDDAFSTYRTDYLERYRMRLGNPAWNDQLDRGFHRGFATTPPHLPLRSRWPDHGRGGRPRQHHRRTCGYEAEAGKGVRSLHQNSQHLF